MNFKRSLYFTLSFATTALMAGCCPDNFRSVNPQDSRSFYTLAGIEQRQHAESIKEKDGRKSENRNPFRKYTYSLETSVLPHSALAADFNEDGVSDLLIAYSTEGKNFVTVSTASNGLSPHPFLSGSVNAVNVEPQFLISGDFDSDGHQDIAYADKSRKSLYWKRGDGFGNLLGNREIGLPGTITSIVSGEFGKPDGAVEVIAAVQTSDGPSVLIFRSNGGVVRHAYEQITIASKLSRSSTISNLILAPLDQDSGYDLAILSGRRLSVLYSNGEQESIRLPFVPRFAASGNFRGSYPIELAFLTTSGKLFVGAKESSRWNFQRATSAKSPDATALLRARVSGNQPDDLVVIAPKRIKVFTSGTKERQKSLYADISFDGDPITVLPVRINRDALSDLVVLSNDSTAALSVLLTEPFSTFIVDNTNDEGPGSLRQAILDAEANAGPDTIQFELTDGDHTIFTDGFPLILESLTIDADNPGLNVAIAPQAGSLITGFGIAASSCVIRGFTIQGFQTGIHVIGDSNIIEGNQIGTDLTGTQAVGNLQGIRLEMSNFNVIGGTNGWIPGSDCSGSCNLVSANNSGILIAVGSNSNLIQGNMIGTNVSGTGSLTNGSGVRLEPDSGTNNTVGGALPGSGNLISGNSNGVRVAGPASGLIVQGNWIGTQTDGETPLGNTDGIAIDEAGPNLIGGDSEQASNHIAFNGNGIYIRRTFLTTEGNEIRRNSIDSNTALGVDLGRDGVTPNDVGDFDAGANRLQNFPELSVVESDGINTHIEGFLSSHILDSVYPITLWFYDNPACHLSGFGEGRNFVGTFVLNSPVVFSIDFPIGVTNVTALATDAAGNSSEFSQCIPAGEIETAQLALEPEKATRIIGSPHTITATLTDGGSPVSGEPLTFNITGTNQAAGVTCSPSNCTTGTNGKVEFTYTSVGQNGFDRITVSGNNGSPVQTAEAKWSMYCATGPLPIPASGKAEFEFNIADDFQIGDVNSSVFLEHPTNRISIELASPPSSQTVYLFLDLFRPESSNFGSSCGAADASYPGPDTIFDDQASRHVISETLQAPFIGKIRPFNTIPNIFDDCRTLDCLREFSSEGTWNLSVSNRSRETGTLHCACLEISQALPDCNISSNVDPCFIYLPNVYSVEIVDQNLVPIPNADVRFFAFYNHELRLTVEPDTILSGTTGIGGVATFVTAQFPRDLFHILIQVHAFSEVDGKAAACTTDIGQTAPLFSTPTQMDLSALPAPLSALAHDLPEITQILSGDSNLLKEYLRLYSAFNQAMRDLNGNGNAEVTAQFIASLDRLLSKVSAKGSTDLNARLLRARNLLTDPAALQSFGFHIRGEK